MSSQAELKNRLKALLSLPENQTCVDCNDGQPRCASLIVPPPGAPTNTPIGALCCLECAGPHRKLGAHVASVRSISLDTWNDNEVYSLETWGNTKVNALFEARLPRINDKPITRAKGGTRDRFIRDKYERRRFYDETVFKKIEEQQYRSDRKLQQHKHDQSRNIKNQGFEVSNARDMDWASDMFSGQAAVPIEPMKGVVTDDSLFSESSDFSDFESDGGFHRRRRKPNGRGVKLNELDIDSSERSKKARSTSNRPPPPINGQIGSVVPCFQLDSNKSNSWGVSIDDVDDDFEPSEFESEECSSDDSCGLRARQKLVSLQAEASKMTADERKAAKTERREKRRAIRIRQRLEIEGSESDDEISRNDHPKAAGKKTSTKYRRGATTTSNKDDRSTHRNSRTSNSSRVSPPHHEKSAPRRTFLRKQGSERSISTSGSGGSKDSAKSNSDAEQKRTVNLSLLEGVLEESNSETVDDEQRGRRSSRNRLTSRSPEKARGRSNNRDPELSEDRERSQSRVRKQGRRESSRSQSHSRSQSRRRDTSRSRPSDNINSLKKTSLLGNDDSDASDNETGLLRKSTISTSTQPRNGKPTSSPRGRSPSKQEGQQRIRRATLSFGQSCLDHATNSGCSTGGTAEGNVPSMRRATPGLVAGPGPTLHTLSTEGNVITNKINPLVPPKHDKAIDNLLKNRRLRGAEPGPTQSATSKSAYKAALSKFQK